MAELAHELELPKGTVYGILRTLQTVGFVEQDPESRKYQLGAALLHIGSSYLDGNELRTRALIWADSLAVRSGESVFVGTLHESLVLIVHHVLHPEDSFQTLEIGSLMPAHATALGKALLAHHRSLADDLAACTLPGYTAATIIEPRKLDRQLDQASERGWASEIGELLPEVASIAAPIEDRNRVVIGAIGLAGTIERICRDRSPRPELVGYVMESARTISRELGAGRW